MQTIMIKGTGEKFDIDELVFPFLETGVLYLRMVVVDKEDNPTHFLVTTPSDIRYRLMPYEQSMMDEIVEESAKANQAYVNMAEDQKEEEKEEVSVPENHEGYYG